MSYRKRTHCSNGHEYTKKNTLYGTKNGYTIRRCRKCRSVYDKSRYWNKPGLREKVLARAKERNKARLEGLSPRFDDQTSPQAHPPDLPR